jgi:hypothetical protein
MEGGTMFRFTIRELLILTVTAGLAVGWWVDHRTMEIDKERAIIDLLINPPEPCGFSQTPPSSYRWDNVP